MKYNYKIIPIDKQYLMINPCSGDWMLIDSDSKEMIEQYENDVPLDEIVKSYADFDPESINELIKQLGSFDFVSKEDVIDACSCANCHDGYFPKLAVLKLTENCNLRCTYCYMNSGGGKHKSMTPEVAIKTVNDYIDMNPNGGIRVVMHGGEPILNRKVMYALAEYAKEHKEQITLAIQTNATLITEEIAAFFSENGISVGISLDGPSDINDLTRIKPDGTGSFADIMRGIDNLRAYGVSYGIISVLNKSVASRIDDVIDLYLDLGIYEISFSPFLKVGRGKDDTESYITGDEMFEAYKRVIDRIISNNLSADKKGFLRERILNHLINNIFANKRTFMCSKIPCGAGRSILGISTEGGIYICDDFINNPDFKIGTVGEISIKEQLLHSPVLLKLIGKKASELPRCKDCTWRQICGGVCYSSDYYSGEYGVSENEMCVFYQKVIPYIFELYSKEPRIPELLSSDLNPENARDIGFYIQGQDYDLPVMDLELFESLLQLHAVNRNDDLKLYVSDSVDYTLVDDMIAAAQKRGVENITIIPKTL